MAKAQENQSSDLEEGAQQAVEDANEEGTGVFDLGTEFIFPIARESFLATPPLRNLEDEFSLPDSFIDLPTAERMFLVGTPVELMVGAADLDQSPGRKSKCKKLARMEA